VTFQAVGTIVGSYFGPVGSVIGPVGSVIGSFIGAQIDASQAPDIEGPRLDDRTVQVSTYGVANPIVYAAERVAGNFIWPRDFQVDEHSNTQSAKGGGPDTTTFSYTASFAILLTDCELEGIGRIWANKKLVYDPNAFPTTDPSIPVMRVYLGTETQTPDPLMVARDGSAPAYRGNAYIVFEDMELSQFGNRPPSLEVEVFTKAQEVGPPTPRVVTLGVDETVPTNTAAIATVDPDTKWVWTARNGFLVNDLNLTVVSDVGQQVIATFTQSEPSANGFSVSNVVATPAEVWVLVNTWPFPDRHAYIARFTKGVAAADGSAATAPAFIGWFRVSDGPIDSHAMAYEPTTNKIWISYAFTNATATSIGVVNPFTRLTEYSAATGVIIGHPFAICPAYPYVGILGGLGGSNPNFLIFDALTHALLHTITLPSNYLQGKALDYDSKRKAFIVLAQTGRSYHLVDAASGSVTTHSFAESANHDTTPPINTSNITGITYFPRADKYIVGTNSSSTLGSTLYIINAGSQVVEHTYTYETGASNLLINPLLLPATDGAYVLGFDLTHVKRLYIGGGILGGPVTLASIVQDICTRAPFGLDAADIDVTQLTDLVDGYLIGQQMTRRAALEPLQAAYFFDAVESDHKLKFVKRGQAPAVTIPLADRAAHEEGSELPAHLAITRASELELPWTIDINYQDKGRDYQVNTQYDRRITRNANDPVRLDLAIVMTAAKAKQVALVNLYTPWLRTRFTFSTTLAYAKYEPTDVVVLPTEEASYIARLTSRGDEGNGLINWEAQLEDIAVYSQSGIVASDSFVPQTIANPGTTDLLLLDTPLLRDADDNAGFYLAGGGTTDGWRGAQVYKSADGGSTYDPLLALTAEAAIGIAQSVLADFTAGNIFDEGNSVIVRLTSGGPLVSATETQVLNGSNAAVLGQHGRWEVIQFKNAVLIAPDVYQLSGLLRGRRGSEWATGTHATGDRFVLASTATWMRATLSSAEIGLARLYKAPPFRTSLSSANAVSFVDAAVGLEPYAPVDITGARDGSNNLTIAWHRRSRIGYGTLNAIVPLGEASEAYEVEIMNGATVLRTIASGTQSASYSAANQTTDGLTPGNPVSVRIYQLSATVARGYAGVATV
jgi:hypothetical protein